MSDLNISNATSDPKVDHATMMSVDPLAMTNPVPEREVTQFTSRIVGIKTRDTGRVYDYDAGEMTLTGGDKVVVEVDEKGPVVGTVSKPPFRIFPAELLKLRLRPVTRIASEQDLETRKKNAELEADFTAYTKRMIAERKLPMRLVGIEYPLSGKVTFVYYVSEDRVDFRDLLKDLTYYMKTKVELRQLGARDETKLIGAIGPCGQETCCSKFLKSFAPVSIKMAKDQGIALNPTKTSGMCGRLKCCLAYEQDAYTQAKKGLPKIGGCVKCSSAGSCGVGKVVKVEVLKQLVTVIFEDGTSQTVPASEVIEQETIKAHTAGQPQHTQVATPKKVEPTPTAAAVPEVDLTKDLKEGTVRFVDGKKITTPKKQDE